MSIYVGSDFTMCNIVWSFVDLSLYIYIYYVDGSHPFYLELRSSGNAHSVFLRNSNGMDVVLDASSLRYNAIGGICILYQGLIDPKGGEGM